MRKMLVVCLITLTAGFSSACVASRKFVRNEVKTSSDALNSKIDATNGELKETRDSVDRVNQRVTTVDGRVTELDSKTTQNTQNLNSLRGEVQTVDRKAGDAQDMAELVAGDVTELDQKFQNRNRFSVITEKAVQFKFDSAQLDAAFKADLDQIAEALMENPNAIVVLEGRTDSTGQSDYNVKLGERRVEAVRRYLAVEKNVPVYRIHEISLGAARPIAANDTKEGRLKNRAVTISVLAPAPEGAVAAKDSN